MHWAWQWRKHEEGLAQRGRVVGGRVVETHAATVLPVIAFACQ